MSKQQTEPASLMTTSELRAFQRICSDSGKVLVVAMDQRNSMRDAMKNNGDQAEQISNEDLGVVKCRLVEDLGNYAPALLLDPECALPKAVDEGVLSRDTALIVSLDASGYDRGENSGLRESRVVQGVNARRVRDLGGDAGKLLVFMRPDNDDGDSFAQELIKKTVEDFQKENVLLVVEILVYRLEGETKEQYLQLKPELILESAKLAVKNGAKFLKLQYPGSAEASAKITAAMNGVPWAVLSQGVDHEVFIDQLKAAMGEGAIGAIAGRALWKDCVSLNAEEMNKNLRDKARPRLDEILHLLS